MSRQIRRKPVPGLSVPRGPSTPTSSTSDFVESPTAMESPTFWSAGSTLVDPRSGSRPSSLATELRVGEQSAKENGEETSSTCGMLVELSIAEKTIHPPSFTAQCGIPASLEDRPAPNPIQPLGEVDVNIASAQSAPTRSKSEIVGSKIKYAYGEVRHFAAGLVSHPHESTKHYSILRHSFGLVYYSGHYTSLAISVFADRDLPPDRSFWLQRKGFSGNAGLKIGALIGTKSAWIDVTPIVQASPDHIKPADERAYQRDIGRFRRKASKKIAMHTARETCILRIPCEAYDGYLRIVMCSGEKGKKVLCPSPLFRLFSTSAESSSIRGSSLKTLPVEVAIKVGSAVANNAATAAIAATAGPAVASAKSFVGGQVSTVWQPGGLKKKAVTFAYNKASADVTKRVDELEQQADDARYANHQRLPDETYHLLAQPEVIGDDAGPQKPYPVCFHGRVAAGTGKSTMNLGAPTANLINVDSDIGLRYSGVYFGWAAINLPKKMQETLLVDDDWHEAIIYIISCPDSRAGVVQRKVVKVHVLQDFDNAKFYDAKLSIIMMGLLRPVDTSQHGKEEEIEIQHANLVRDAACTTASLARTQWEAESTLTRIKSDASDRTLKERYVDMRQSTQSSVDKVPLHKLGVRTDGADLRDRLIGNGGIYIRR